MQLCLKQQAYGTLFFSLNGTQAAWAFFWAHQHNNKTFLKVQIYSLREKIKTCTSGPRDNPSTSLAMCAWL